MNFVRKLIKDRSEKTLIEVNGSMGHYSKVFEKDRKIYIFKVSHVFDMNELKVKFKFDRKTNLLECWTNSRYGTKSSFNVYWKQSDKDKRINI